MEVSIRAGSSVFSCAVIYAYPIIPGKVNHITAGYYHGLKSRKACLLGLRIIAIPYQKIDEVAAALDEMPWIPIAFKASTILVLCFDTAARLANHIGLFFTKSILAAGLYTKEIL